MLRRYITAYSRLRVRMDDDVCDLDVTGYLHFAAFFMDAVGHTAVVEERKLHVHCS